MVDLTTNTLDAFKPTAKPLLKKKQSAQRIIFGVVGLCINITENYISIILMSNYEHKHCLHKQYR